MASDYGITACREIMGDRILNIIRETPFQGKFVNLEEPIHNKFINLEEPDGDNRTFKVPLIDYVFIANSALQVMNYESGDYTMNYLEYIFKMYDMDRTACTGKITLNSYFYEEDDRTYREIFVFINNERVKINDENKNEKMTVLAEECLKRIKKASCTIGNFTFTSLALGSAVMLRRKDKPTIKGGHANILLILKNNITKDIKIIKYEPHGYEISDEIVTYVNRYNNEFVRELVGYMSQIEESKQDQPYTFNIMEPIQIGCNIGIQQYIYDVRGYCALISAFWMFIVLGLMKSDFGSDTTETIFDNLNIVERCLYNNFNEEQLNVAVVNFSVQVINDYLKLIVGGKINRMFRSICVELLFKFYGERGMNPFTLIVKDEKRHKRHSEQIHEETDPSEEQKNAQNDCEPCIKQTDCKSGNCKNNVCVAPGEYRPKLLIGDPCEYHDECCSETCIKQNETDVNKRCVKNPDMYKIINKKERKERKPSFFKSKKK